MGLSDLVYLLMVLMVLVVTSCEFEPFEVVVGLLVERWLTIDGFVYEIKMYYSIR